MQYIRILPRKQWDPTRGEFKSLAFKPSSDGGISVIAKPCADTESNTVCAHIRKKYSQIADEPPIFWEFSSDLLPDHARFVSTPGPGDDPCHTDIMGLRDQEARKVLKAASFEEFSICENGEHRKLRASDLNT